MHFVVANFWPDSRNLQRRSRRHVPHAPAGASKAAPPPVINPIRVGGDAGTRPPYGHPAANDLSADRKRA